MARLIVPLLLLTISALFTTTTVSAEDPPKPCSTPEHQQFSFWLGKWTAYSRDGKKLGTNHLHKVMGNCAMQENWNSNGGKFTGTSYNFYDEASKQWHQTWIDNSGGHLLLNGNFVDGSMQLSGKRKGPKGKMVTDRITWTPLEDGRVRQHWQSSVDGETWSEVFDGYYQKD